MRPGRPGWFFGLTDRGPNADDPLGRKSEPLTSFSPEIGEFKLVDGQAELQKDIDNFKAALAGVNVAGAFLPANTPGTIEHWMANEYYKSDEAFLVAIAEAMRVEYNAIVGAGFLLQIDDPDLPDGWACLPDITLSDYRKYATLRIDALNHALRGIPEERSRYHICWGSWNGPHAFDVPLKDIIGLLLQVRTGHYSFEAANPRHAHEWRVWETVKLSSGKILIPGVISHATNIVEHPELVAERIVRLAKIVGRENVMGGTDCGFAQSPFARRVHPTIMWAKLKSLVEGARIATQELWGRSAAA